MLLDVDVLTRRVDLQLQANVEEAPMVVVMVDTPVVDDSELVGLTQPHEYTVLDRVRVSVEVTALVVVEVVLVLVVV